MGSMYDTHRWQNNLIKELDAKLREYENKFEFALFMLDRYQEQLDDLEDTIDKFTKQLNK